MNDLSHLLNRLFDQLEDHIDRISREITDLNLLKEYGCLLFRVEPAERKVIETWRQRGPIAAVDGSVIRIGEMTPHYIDIFQAVASVGMATETDIVLQDSFTPLLEGTDSEGYSLEMERAKEKKLAQIEMKAALEVLDRDPSLLIMDGSLIRYRIFDYELYAKMLQKALAKKTIICGVIEDIKTRNLQRFLEMTKPDFSLSFYDREGLFNRLQIGEVLIFDPKFSPKETQEMTSAFTRFSKEPGAISIDFVDEQKKDVREVLEVLFALTKPDGRGIPYLLDIVDQKCKLTHRQIVNMMKQQKKRQIYEFYFNAQRYKR